MDLQKRQQMAIEIPDNLKGIFKLENNMEGVIPRLVQIKILHTAQMLEFSGNKVDSLEAVFIDQHPANAWWKKNISESGAGKVPDCFSKNGVYPDEECEDQQAEECGKCQWNEYGSDRKNGKGKDCKNMKRTHVLTEGSMLPKRLSIPPTSITNFEVYMTELVDRGLPYSCVLTKIFLTKKMSEGFVYSEVNFEFVRVLNQDELVNVADKITKYKDAARQQDIQPDEYMNEPAKEEGGEDIPF